jgi:predicted dehydrogenase
MSEEPVRWGLLSTARINAKLIPGLREAPNAELVAVGSRDEGTARAYASEHGIPRAHGSYEALLADPGVDAVYIPLPNALHLPWTLRALETGKHVLCEKPMARRAGDVEAAFDAADRQGLVLMEAFMWRYHHQTERLVELVREGAIGPLRHVRAAFSHTLPEASGDVRWNAELEGGALMDVGCYCVSAMRLLCGEPERVSAESVRSADGVDGRMLATLRFAGDALGSLECAFDTVPRDVLEAVGLEGTLLARDPWHGRGPELLRTGPDGSREEIAVEAVNPYGREVEDFSRAVRGGPAPRLGRDDAVGQARTIEALYRSADEGCAVAL